LHKKGASSKFIKEFSFLSLISAIIKAYIVAALLLPKIIIKRIIIYRKIKKISTKDFINLIKKYSISAKELALKD